MLSADGWKIDPKDRALEIPIPSVKPADTVKIEIEAPGGFCAYRLLKQADEYVTRLATVESRQRSCGRSAA